MVSGIVRVRRGRERARNEAIREARKGRDDTPVLNVVPHDGREVEGILQEPVRQGGRDVESHLLREATGEGPHTDGRQLRMIGDDNFILTE